MLEVMLLLKLLPFSLGLIPDIFWLAKLSLEIGTWGLKSEFGRFSKI